MPSDLPDDRTDWPDVLVRADSEELRHKRREHLDNPHEIECYWTVSGTPRRTGRGGTILFSDGDRVWGLANITRVEDGKIWFKPIRDATSLGIDPPVDAPMRGFRYITEAMADGE